MVFQCSDLGGETAQDVATRGGHESRCQVRWPSIEEKVVVGGVTVSGVRVDLLRDH